MKEWIGIEHEADKTNRIQRFAVVMATRQISLRVPRLEERGHVVLDTRTLNVKMPRGVRAGQIIGLAGQGTPGYHGGPPGAQGGQQLRVRGKGCRPSRPCAPG